MAKKSRQDELIERLHADGIRKRVATVIAGRRGGAKKSQSQARALLGRLEDATAAIRSDVLGGGGSSRSEAGKKAAATRKKNAAKRRAAAKKGAATRARKKAKA